jgi:hypothetical protein
MGLVKADFGQLDALQATVTGAIARLKAEQEDWKKISAGTAAEWQDVAGDGFITISEQFNRVTESSLEVAMLLTNGIQAAKDALQEALSSALARFS